MAAARGRSEAGSLALRRRCRPGRASRARAAPPEAQEQLGAEGGGASGAADAADLASLFRILVPSVSIWLASPVMSLVDTAVVGVAPGATAELAALGPATVLVDYLSFVFTFIAIATTSVVSRARARRDTDGVTRGVSDGLSFAAVSGAALAAFLLLFAEPLLKAWGLPTDVVKPALAYTLIRATAMPAALLTGVAQASFLALRDTRTPLLATVLAALVNLAGDVVLVCWCGYGLAGAAAATAASQLCCTAVLLRKLLQPLPSVGAPAPLSELPSRLPTRAAVVEMAKLGGPVAIVIIIKVMFISTLCWAASVLGAVPAAAHAVCMSIYTFFAVIGDAVSQVAQVTLPGLLGDAPKALAAMRRLIGLGAAIGAANAALAASGPLLLPGAFTSSASVVEAIGLIGPVMLVALVFHTAAMATEGMLLAGRDLGFMVRSYSFNMVLSVSACFLAQKGFRLGVPAVWGALALFHGVRLCANAARLGSKAGPLRNAAA